MPAQSSWILLCVQVQPLPRAPTLLFLRIVSQFLQAMGPVENGIIYKRRSLLPVKMPCVGTTPPQALSRPLRLRPGPVHARKPIHGLEVMAAHSWPRSHGRPRGVWMSSHVGAESSLDLFIQGVKESEPHFPAPAPPELQHGLIVPS